MDEMIEIDEEIFEDSFIVIETDSRVWIEQYGVENQVGFLRAVIERGAERQAAENTAKEQSQKAIECSFCKAGLRRIISEKYRRGAWKWCSHDPEIKSKYTSAD